MATNVDFIEIGDYVKNLDVVKRFTENPDVDINFLEDEALTLKKNVELVKTEFDLPLEVAFNQMDISKVGGVEEKEFSENDYPMEIEAISDISYDETIKKKHRLIVKKYFEAINY